ncbi:hypothetical protein KDK95_24500 [Actinospica sp. MGRD01-02]|uniref:Uncharacterized protein n=1 Tax=Actinospica acidithermotolerans TaxID=2828514 RepID=A0A941EKY9_9ACTN|nr:hypothetical protein [Actinospica acidithermotolerans]MBR7829489.1 hypothetical protein [Actinospica acidithermotolerans]
MTAGLAVLGALLGLVYAMGLSRDSTSLANLKARTDGVSATSDLYYRLNDMDAMAANVLLVGYNPADASFVPASVNATASNRVYESDRTAADVDLETIAQNQALAAQGDKLMNALGEYEELIAQALYIDKATLHEQPAAPPASALGLYVQASALLHSTLLPTSQQITDTDSGEVDAAYSGDRSSMIGIGIAVLLIGLLAALALFLGNHYHARAFRRRVGWLVPGMLVAVVLGAVGINAQLTAADQLQYAKQNAYDSINALERAKAISDDANADESRWLLENQASSLGASFNVKVTQVNAYLATELHNITFPGEGQAANAAASEYRAYLDDDATIRSDAESENPAAAVAFDIGTQAGTSNYTFNAYLDDLNNVIRINDDYFVSTIAAGQSDLGGGAWALMILGELLLLAFVAQAGYLRLREYR